MINKEENERKNVQLLNLYNENKDGFLLEYIKIYKDENPPDIRTVRCSDLFIFAY